jgi:hypothetical protein
VLCTSLMSVRIEKDRARLHGALTGIELSPMIDAASEQNLGDYYRKRHYLPAYSCMLAACLKAKCSGILFVTNSHSAAWRYRRA